MSGRQRTTRKPKTRPCDAAHAKVRLREAEVFLDVAFRHGPTPDAAERAVDASNAVLAAIAAADAACCAALGRRNDSSDHAAAETLLAQVAGGKQPSLTLRRILTLKSNVQYVGGKTSQRNLDDARSWAKALVKFAEAVVV